MFCGIFLIHSAYSDTIFLDQNFRPSKNVCEGFSAVTISQFISVVMNVCVDYCHNCSFKEMDLILYPLEETVNGKNFISDGSKPIGQEYSSLQVSEIFLSRPAVSA